MIRMMSKVTLSIDPAVVVRAKRYAKRRGVSVSSLVEEYLDLVSEPPRSGPEPPVLRSLRGVLKKADRDAYRRRLIEKYG